MANDNEILKELTDRVNGIAYPDVVSVGLVGNIATLGGVVRSLAKKNEIAMAAAYVSGVEGVDNRLTVRAPEYIL
ncbi:MAG TPA: BON domain-containing protein [Puia sp.]|nr:BON domain-containing protein [Puia sp.]